MYQGKMTTELEKLSEEYYKMFGHFPSGHEELEYGKNDYKDYVRDIKKALKIKKELQDFVR